MNAIKFDKILTKKPCPVCEGKAILKRWNLKYTEEAIFSVECKNCYLHSEIADNPTVAVKNWEDERFGDTQKMLMRNLNKSEVEVQEVANLISRIIETVSVEYKELYKTYLKIKDKIDDESLTERKRRLQAAEREFKMTIEYWCPNMNSKDVVETVKKQVEKDFEESIWNLSSDNNFF